MQIYDNLFDLSSKCGVSGFEEMIAEDVRALFESVCNNAWIDHMGNVIALKKSKNANAKKVMIDAHMDEIGLIVIDIDEKGFLKFTSSGGIDERLLPASEVVVHGKENIHGIIGIKPPHIQSDDENKKTIKMSELAIDIGYSYEDAKKLVTVGTPVSFYNPPRKLLNSQVSGKSFDNRASICAMLKCAEEIKDKDLDIDVYFVCSIREETNTTGAISATYQINPDYALVIDVTHGITADNSQDAFKLGDGISVSAGPNINKPLFKLLKSIVIDKGYNLNVEVDGGNTGTNAWKVQISRSGIATALISIPLRYMHTPTEVLDIKDIEIASDVASEFIYRLSKGDI